MMRHFRYKDGLLIVNSSDKPIFDTRMYEVEYPDGYKASLYANSIAENIFHKLMVRGIYTSYLRISLIKDITDQRSSRKIFSSQ